MHKFAFHSSVANAPKGEVCLLPESERAAEGNFDVHSITVGLLSPLPLPPLCHNVFVHYA